MAPLSDRKIRELSLKRGMIEPFAESSLGPVISFGLSSYGYDYRLADSFMVPRADFQGPLDPKAVPADLFQEVKGAESLLLAPRSFLLARSLEYFRIPREVLVLGFGKSTLARSGLLVNVTPLEPEWEGHLTLSLANLSPYPLRLYANEGIGQLVFLEASDLCERSYRDKKGKYQNQKVITPSKVE